MAALTTELKAAQAALQQVEGALETIEQRQQALAALPEFFFVDGASVQHGPVGAAELIGHWCAGLVNETTFVFAADGSMDDWMLIPAVEALHYLCIVTATTVGYGDLGVSDQAGPKLYACVHILYSVSSLAALLNTVQDLYSDRRTMLRKGVLLQRQLDVDLIQSLDKDNNGLDKLEFIVSPSSPP